MLRKGPNGMRALELLAEMQVKDWSFFVITDSATMRVC